MQKQLKTEKPAEPLSLKASIGILATLILVGGAFVGGVGYKQVQARAEAETARVALVAKQQVEADKLVKIQAAKITKITKKKGGKMVKILRGKTGQADLDASMVPNPGCSGGIYAQEGGWEIVGVASYKAALDSYTGQAGWGVAEGGVITVPMAASPGLYTAYYSPGAGICAEVPDGDETWKYEFEVVCMKVTVKPYTRFTD